MPKVTKLFPSKLIMTDFLYEVPSISSKQRKIAEWESCNKELFDMFTKMYVFADKITENKDDKSLFVLAMASVLNATFSSYGHMALTEKTVMDCIKSDCNLMNLSIDVKKQPWYILLKKIGHGSKRAKFFGSLCNDWIYSFALRNSATCIKQNDCYFQCWYIDFRNLSLHNKELEKTQDSIDSDFIETINEYKQWMVDKKGITLSESVNYRPYDEMQGIFKHFDFKRNEVNFDCISENMEKSFDCLFRKDTLKHLEHSAKAFRKYKMNYTGSKIFQEFVDYSKKHKIVYWAVLVRTGCFYEQCVDILVDIFVPQSQSYFAGIVKNGGTIDLQDIRDKFSIFLQKTIKSSANESEYFKSMKKEYDRSISTPIRTSSEDFDLDLSIDGLVQPVDLNQTVVFEDIFESACKKILKKNGFN